MGAEHPRVRGVHLGKLANVDEEHTTAQDVLQPGAGGFENGLDILQTLRRLCFDVAGDELPGRRVGGTLSGHEHEAFEPDTWRVRADGCGKIRTADVLVRRLWHR